MTQYDRKRSRPPFPRENAAKQAALAKQRWAIAGIIAGVVVLAALLVWAIVALSRNPAAAANAYL